MTPKQQLEARVREWSLGTRALARVTSAGICYPCDVASVYSDLRWGWHAVGYAGWVYLGRTIAEALKNPLLGVTK